MPPVVNDKPFYSPHHLLMTVFANLPSSIQPLTATPRPRADWSAVERDYRTGKFTLRELASKYGVSHQAVSKQVKNGGWTQDLSLAVRQATESRLFQQVVDAEVAKSSQAVADTVMAAAEVNMRVILTHRMDAQRARQAMEAARVAVLACGASVTRMSDAATFAAAVESLGRSTKIAIDIERKAFRLDEEQPQKADEEDAAVSISQLLARFELVNSR